MLKFVRVRQSVKKTTMCIMFDYPRTTTELRSLVGLGVVVVGTEAPEDLAGFHGTALHRLDPGPGGRVSGSDITFSNRILTMNGKCKNIVKWEDGKISPPALGLRSEKRSYLMLETMHY